MADSDRPRTVKEAKTRRRNAKRTVTTLSKEGRTLLAAKDGLPESEFRDITDRLRRGLSAVRTTNEYVIELQCSDLKADDYANERDMEQAEQSIASTEEAYYDEVSDATLPLIYELVRRAENIGTLKPKHNTTTTSGSVNSNAQTIASRMAKLKFPTFSGDLRDYKRFKQQFRYFTADLKPIEQLYQLIESMEKQREKNKIKNCMSIDKAWPILDQEYGDDDRLIDTLIADLDRIEPYHTKGHVNLGSMNRFVETLQNFATHFENLGMQSDLNSRIMLTQLRRKLPEDHHIAYLESVRDGKSDNSITGLVNFLHSYLTLLQKTKAPPDARARGDRDKPTSGKLSPKGSLNNGAAIPDQTTSDNKSAKDTSKKQEKSTPKCPLHPENKSHYLKACNKFRALKQHEKFDVMNKNGICHRCGHNNCAAGKPPFDPQNCEFIKPCQVPTCGADTHFAAICPRVYGQDGYRHFEKRLNVAATVFTPTQGVPTGNVATSISDQISCVLPTVMAYLIHGSKKTPVRILLDTGSQTSIVREGIVPKSDNTHMQDFNLTTVGGVTRRYKLRVVECTIESLDGEFSRNVRLTEMKKPCGDAPIVTKEQLNEYSHLQDVDISEAPSTVIDVLLGVENADILLPDRRIIGPNDGDPIAARCPLGWYIQGGCEQEDSHVNASLNFIQVTTAGELEDFLGLEKVGLEPKHCKCYIETENKRATESMRQSLTKLDNGGYQVALPWKKPPTDLPNNYDFAMRRFLNLEKQFLNRPSDWEIYCKQMEDQLKRGVAREVSQVEMERDLAEGNNMWFLPHFAVLKDSDTTPVRVVYDSKARFQGHSLNDYLAKGENMNLNLFEIGLRFREKEVGVVADISKMFQAVKLTQDDARYHRYLFRPTPTEPVRVYELTTVTFGDKPSPTAAVVALRHVAREYAPDDQDMHRVITKQFYVDDLSESKRSTNDAAQLKSDLTALLRKGNFNIRKWLSNKREVCDPDYIPPDGRTTVLGTNWDLTEDTLNVKEVQADNYVPTKRNILKKAASYYDVFGMLSGLTVKPRILLQKLWQFDLDWDTPISQTSDLYTTWQTTEQDLKEASLVKIKRCLIPERFHGKEQLPDLSLHGASDASEDAMAMGVWLRWAESEDSDADLTFVCAKARLTPLKQSSIPRKELQAMLLLSRLMLTVREALRFDIKYMKMWTDSVTTIGWLRGQSKAFRSYVACRVGEITTDFNPSKDIAYVPSELNVIDLVSRGTTADGMQRVISGPTYLCQPPSQWPRPPANIQVDKEDTELKKFHIRNAKVLSAGLTTTEPIVDPTKYSNWSRLVMITARILSLKDLPKGQWIKQLCEKLSTWPSRQRVKEAELYWIRYAQREIDLADHNIQKLHPILDEAEGVYRVGGRIDKAPLSFDLRHPYLLPKRSHISFLIARERHLHALHGGHLRTVAEIRKKYWMIGDINISRQIVRICKQCIRHRGKPLEQKMADLPMCRVTPFTPPFQTTAVDYLGPINVKLTRNTVSKGYCAVFTCAVTRAVHLTCVQDLSTPAFIQALERFISIRGAPAQIFSDNATCFRGASNEIRDLQIKLDKTQIQSNIYKYNTEWKFGPPGGPHHQGIVERMVQEIKKSMKYMVHAEKLTFIEWETVLCQISALINSRPITAVSSSPLDEPPVTPNHFLIGRGDLPCPQVPSDSYIGDSRKRRELCNQMVDGFWRRWMSNIHRLSPRHKWSKAKENLGKGDIVLIVEENTKRGQWKLAEIMKTYPGNDNLVRVVDLKLADGQSLKRPITKLILLLPRSERLDMDRAN